MGKFQKPPLLPELKFNRLREEGEMEAMYARFNQSVLLFRRQDQFLTRFHVLHDEALGYDPSGTSLAKCYSALRHATMVLYHAFRKDKRERLSKKLKKWGEDYNKAFATQFGGIKQINSEDYGNLHNQLLEICDIIYKAQQETGLGVVMERKETEHGKLDEAMLQ